jgi:FtsZ-binding cell division protein ZapB
MSHACDVPTNHSIHLKTIMCLRNKVKQLKEENDALQKRSMELQQNNSDELDTQCKRLRSSAQEAGLEVPVQVHEDVGNDTVPMTHEMEERNKTLQGDIERLTKHVTKLETQRDQFGTRSARWKPVFVNAYIFQRAKCRSSRRVEDYPCDDAAVCVPNLIAFADGIGAGDAQSGNVARVIVDELAKVFTVNPFLHMPDRATKFMLLEKNCAILDSVYRTENVQKVLKANHKGSTTLTYMTIDHKDGCFIIQGLQLGDSQCALLSMSSVDLRWTCEYITTNSYVNKVKQIPSQLGMKVNPKHVTQDVENAAEIISFRVPDCKKYLLVWGTDGLWDNLGVDNRSSSRVQKLLSVCNAVTPTQHEWADIEGIIGKHLEHLATSVMASEDTLSKKDDITFGVSSISMSCDAFLNDSSQLFTRRAFCQKLFHAQVRLGLKYLQNASSGYFEDLMCTANITSPSKRLLHGFEPWVFKTLMCDCLCGRSETSCPKAHSAINLRCKLYARFGMCPFAHCCLKHTITPDEDLELMQRQA